MKSPVPPIRPHRPPRPYRRRAGALLASGLTACALAVTLAIAPRTAGAQVTNSSLYYRLGGGSPFGGTLNRSQLAIHLGLSVRLNYSCGKFDIGVSWSNLMNQVQQLGQAVEGALQSAIAALPMYILERAQPGLYELFQTYSAKADLLIAAALKNCQQMEQAIKDKKDPYMDFVNAAKDIQWRVAINDGKKDIIEAQSDIDKDEKGQKAGIKFVDPNQPQGGVGQKAIQPNYDLTVAGYHIICNATPSLDTASSTTLCPPQSRIAATFKTPSDMAKWSTQVLGDKEIHTCNEKDCPQPTPPGGTTAMGLGPKLQDEIDFVGPILATVLADPEQNKELAKISTEGFVITPDLMASIRRLPPDTQGMALARLTQEMAMHRVVSKALMVRSALLAGLSIPDVAKVAAAQTEVQQSLDRLSHYLDDLLYEWRIRKEITGQSALTLMSESQWGDSQRALQPSGTPDDPPLINGAVKTNDR